MDENSLGTITLEDKYEIIGNIEDEYNYSEENICKMLQDIGFKPRNLSESDIVTAIRRGNGNYGVGTFASRRRGDEAYQNRSGIDSGGYKGEISGEGESGIKTLHPSKLILRQFRW